jgi:hypothetical protein
MPAIEEYQLPGWRSRSRVRHCERIAASQACSSTMPAGLDRKRLRTVQDKGRTRIDRVKPQETHDPDEGRR